MTKAFSSTLSVSLSKARKFRAAEVFPGFKKMRLATWIAIMITVFGPLLPTAIGKASWNYCSSSTDYKVSVQDVVVDPDPVLRGSDALFKIPAKTDEPIIGGTLVVEVYYLGFPVYREKYDMCTKTSCPVAPGLFTIQNSQRLPGYTPPGSYRLDMRLQDENGDTMTCVTIRFRIVRSALQAE